MKSTFKISNVLTPLQVIRYQIIVSIENTVIIVDFNIFQFHSFFSICAKIMINSSVVTVN